MKMKVNDALMQLYQQSFGHYVWAWNARIFFKKCASPDDILNKIINSHILFNLGYQENLYEKIKTVADSFC